MTEKVNQDPNRARTSVRKESVFQIPCAGRTRKEQLMRIIDFSTDLYDFIREWWKLEGASETMTSAFATFISNNFKFADFPREEIRKVLYREADSLRKDRRKRRR